MSGPDYVRALLRGRRPGTAEEARAAVAAAEERWCRVLSRKAAIAMMVDEDAAVPLLEAQLRRNAEMREHVRESRARTVEDTK